MGVELLPGVEVVGWLPAVYVRRLRAVVLADLHIGFEEEAAEYGYFLPRVQFRRGFEVTVNALDETGADWVIFAGDVKHHFSRLSRVEREELDRLFGELSRRGVRVTVVRGNHDNFLPPVAKRHGVEIVQELLVDRILIVHGHKPIGEREGVDVIIMGHEHPSIRLRDRLGYVAKLSCFLVGRHEPSGAGLIVLPAVGQYQTGTTVSLSPDTYLSPVLRREVVLEKLKPYVLAEEVGVLEFPELGLLEDLLAEVTV